MTHRRKPKHDDNAHDAHLGGTGNSHLRDAISHLQGKPISAAMSVDSGFDASDASATVGAAVPANLLLSTLGKV